MYEAQLSLSMSLNVSIQLALVGPLLTGYGAQVTHM